jgi:hypothetical protein
MPIHIWAERTPPFLSSSVEQPWHLLMISALSPGQRSGRTADEMRCVIRWRGDDNLRDNGQKAEGA